MIPTSGAVFLVPLNDYTSRHCGWFERDDRVERILADDYSARVLSQVAREVLRHVIKLAELPDTGMLEIESRLAELALYCFVGILPFPVADKAAELL
jgi:hypothetical protein